MGKGSEIRVHFLPLAIPVEVVLYISFSARSCCVAPLGRILSSPCVFFIIILSSRGASLVGQTSSKSVLSGQ